jgi:primosomal protein N' (replication factor Y)
MIAKGHDYPSVTLVGVINADTGLTLPDFRAAETGFQLLTQVAGRAGRGDIPGKVYIQTYRPKHFAITHAAEHDYPGFFKKELEYRQQAAYPPFRRMMNLTVESEDLLQAEKYIARLHRIVRTQMDSLKFDGMELLGPAPATIHRLRNRYRWNLGILSKSTKRLNTLARAARTDFNTDSPANVLLKIDLDPYGMF